MSIAPLVITAMLFGATSDAPSRPNIVFILADDMGYGDAGCYGCKDIRTPAIDRLATQGVRLTNFYANGPECTPTRTALMTGRYQQRVGGLECAIGLANVGRYDDAIRLRETHDLGLPVEEVSIARRLKDAGYTTAAIGKWHLGYEPKFFANPHGFDYAFGPLGGGVDYFYHCEPDGVPMLYLNGKPIKRGGYLTDLITAEAVEQVYARHDKPFFLYVPYTAPHTPDQVRGEKPDGHATMEKWRTRSRPKYVKMVEILDEGIAKILEALDRNRLSDKTLVIFASDNGADRRGSNAPFRGHKSGLFEGGIRVPCVVRWPGKIEPKTVSDQMSIMMDLTASMIRVAGAEAPKDRPFDGVDIIRNLETKQPVYKRTLFWRSRRGERTWRAVRDGGMKYVTKTDGDKTERYLFDLNKDPSETSNLLEDKPEETSRLKDLLDKWQAEVKPRR